MVAVRADRFVPTAADLAEFDVDRDDGDVLPVWADAQSQADGDDPPVRATAPPVARRRHAGDPLRYLRPKKRKWEFRPVHDGRRYHGGLFRTLHEAQKARAAFEADPDAWVGRHLATRHKYIHARTAPDGTVWYEARVEVPSPAGGMLVMGLGKRRDAGELYRFLSAVLRMWCGPLVAAAMLDTGRQTGGRGQTGRGRDWSKGKKVGHLKHRGRG